MASVWRLNRGHAGPEMSRAYALLAASYPDCRILGFASGETAGSWTAPPAWVAEHARLTGPDGRVIADLAETPLALWAFSPAFQGTVSLAELQSHLASDPAHPRARPFHFRNQYRFWEPQWGFSLPHAVRTALAEGSYGVDIATRFEPGRLEMVEQVHAGTSGDSLLLVGSFDHPAQCGNGLAACLAGHEALTRLQGRQTRLTYRMLSTVEIVGSVFYAAHAARQASVREALVLAGLGTASPLTYQRSCFGGGAIDRILAHVLGHHHEPSTVVEFRMGGFNKDECAFEVPGVRIPCGVLMRHPIPNHGLEDDTPETVDDETFERSVLILSRVIDLLEENSLLVPRFEGLPCLSHPSLDLYLSKPSGDPAGDPASPWGRLLARLPDDAARAQCAAVPGRAFALLMTLTGALADGRHTILDLAERAGVPFAVANGYVEMWVAKGLLHKEWVNCLGADQAAN